MARNRYHDELLERLEKGGSISPGLRVVLWRDARELTQCIDRESAALIDREVHVPHSGKHEGLNLLFGLERDGTIKKPHTQTLELDKLHILTPYHGRYAHAARELNEFVHAEYKAKWWASADGFATGEKIIRISNKYEGDPRQLALSNGSIGVVNVASSSSTPRVFFRFPAEVFRINASEQEEYELAYATTVHKAQGSDFDHVFVVLSAHKPLLARELVYTALTRSKQTVTLFVEKSAQSPLALALRRSLALGRNSSIFSHPIDKTVLMQPEPGEFVDSKVEYILYSALMRARDSGKLRFKHHQDVTLATASGPQRVKPDFVIETASGQWYLEHLGMLDLRRYANRWQDKRHAYETAGLSDRLVTTDDLNGILSERVEQVINDLAAEKLITTPKSRFSRHHYTLWQNA